LEGNIVFFYKIWKSLLVLFSVLFIDVNS